VCRKTPHQNESLLAYNLEQARNGTLNALALHGIKERAVE
jgi:hypothetical protein